MKLIIIIIIIIIIILILFFEKIKKVMPQPPVSRVRTDIRF
jgi:hypothetical protein